MSVWGWGGIVMTGYLGLFLAAAIVASIVGAIGDYRERRLRRDATVAHQRRVEVRDAAFAAQRKAMASRMEARRVAQDTWQHQFNDLLYRKEYR